MYNNSYEEYIRSVLGGTNYCEADYFQGNNCSTPNFYNYNHNANDNLEECYPEIYKIVYPMVQKSCQNVNEPITKDTIDRMVEEIYSNVEGNDTIYLNINLENNIEGLNTTQIENRGENINQNGNRNTNQIRTFNGKKIIEEPEKETRAKNEVIPKETRQFNRGLNDIIRILILRELLGRPKNRPPFPPPGRPPFLPYNRPGRPPYSREWNSDIYEY